MPLQGASAHAKEWLDAQPITLLQAYYLTADDDQHDHAQLFCARHAFRAAHALSVLRGVETHVSEAWGGSDNEEWCEICGVALNPGGMTSAGVDSALALTEENPFRSCVSVEGLWMAAEAMLDDDARWPVLVRQVNRLRRRKRRAA